MADDLIQRVIDEAEAWESFNTPIATPRVAPLLREAAGALARKDAEITRRGQSMRELEDILESRRTEIRELRRQVSGAKDVLKAMERSLASSESQRDEQRQRAERAEARVREAPRAKVGGGTIYGGWIEADAPSAWIGESVAIVLLKEPQE